MAERTPLGGNTREMSPVTDQASIEPADPPQPEKRRVLGFMPRTLIIVGVIVAAIMIGEYLWLFSPTSSTSQTTASQSQDAGSSDNAANEPSAGGESASSETTAPTAATTSVTTRATAIIRSGPSKTASDLGTIPKGTSIVIVCVTTGEQVKGATSTDSRWNKVIYGSITGYVSNTLIATGTATTLPNTSPSC